MSKLNIYTQLSVTYYIQLCIELSTWIVCLYICIEIGYYHINPLRYHTNRRVV